jgi:hypothetical protein
VTQRFNRISLLAGLRRTTALPRIASGHALQVGSELQLLELRREAVQGANPLGAAECCRR